MVLQKRHDRPAKLAGAVAVHDPQLLDVGDSRLVEELLEPRDRFVNGVADHVELGQRARARLQVNADVDSRCGSGAADHAKTLEWGAKPLAAHVDLGMLAVHFDHRALESQAADDDASAWREFSLRVLYPTRLTCLTRPTR